MTYWKIENFKKLLEIEKENDLQEIGTITRGYLHDIEIKIKLMEEAYEKGLEDAVQSKGEKNDTISGEDFCNCGHERLKHSTNCKFIFDGKDGMCDCKKFQLQEQNEGEKDD